MALIVLHRHDHDHDHQHDTEHSCKTDTEHSHPENVDCHYCFLFFQQGIELNPAFHWELNPIELQLSEQQVTVLSEKPILRLKYYKSLRAPPFPAFSIT